MSEMGKIYEEWLKRSDRTIDIDGNTYYRIVHSECFNLFAGEKEVLCVVLSPDMPTGKFFEDENGKTIDNVSSQYGLAIIRKDENGKMNLNLETVKGEILSISQFTLFADCRKGNRPSFVSAMKPPMANDMYEYFNTLLRNQGFIVKTGVFGGEMKIELINDGPITIFIDSDDLA